MIIVVVAEGFCNPYPSHAAAKKATQLTKLLLLTLLCRSPKNGSPAFAVNPDAVSFSWIPCRFLMTLEHTLW